MFDTLLESGGSSRPHIQSGLAAFLFHTILLMFAVLATSRSSVISSPGDRDTIRLELPPLPAAPPSPSRMDRPHLRKAPLVPPRGPIPVLDVPPLDPSQMRSPLADLAALAGLPSPARSIETIVGVDSVFSVSEVDELPRLVGAVTPRYPESLRVQGLSGHADLEYVITSSGRADPASMRVVSSTHPEFARSATDAVLGARFRAARKSGRPVPTIVRQRVKFQNR